MVEGGRWKGSSVEKVNTNLSIIVERSPYLIDNHISSKSGGKQKSLSFSNANCLQSVHSRVARGISLFRV